jgi:hypothetical protein
LGLVGLVWFGLVSVGFDWFRLVSVGFSVVNQKQENPGTKIM